MSIKTVMSGPIDRDEIEALPPAPTAVFNALREGDGEMTLQEIADTTFIKQRTVSDALGRLREEDLVDSRWSTDDARERVHRLTDGGESDGD